MDVDSELEGKLLQQFSSMGTTDKEVLISEFQKLLGNQLNAAGCAFFLDMNNWNLQAAIGSYYDFEQPSIRLPSMAFIKDVTVGEGESVPPNTKFMKTWRLQNSGEENWPPGCCLKFCHGDQLTHTDRVMVDALSPGQVADVSVDMVSPSTTGIYQGQWRMTTPTGLYFGEVIWVIIAVDESGLLAVTQQMSRFACEFGRQTAHQNSENPFASSQTLEDLGSTVSLNCLTTSISAHQGNPCSPDVSGQAVVLHPTPSPPLHIPQSESTQIPEDEKEEMMS